MTSEIRTCQNCKSEFVIEPEDFTFYGKIKVPPPTFCSECRHLRRLSWRNERTLYHRKCDATGKDIVTMFAPEQPLKVYERNYWWSDQWDQLASGRDYDFDKPFFQQFRELLEQAPLPNLANTNAVNSEYSNHNVDAKNCYLIYASLGNEDVAYAAGVVRCKGCFDVYKTFNTTQGYDDVLCGDLNRVFFSYDSDESVNSDFLHACRNVTNSLACINLRNKSNFIFNQPYSKDDYPQERAKYDFGSYQALSEFRIKFEDFIKGFPRRHGFIFKSVNAVGDNIMNAKNVYMGFDLFGGVEDCKYVIHGGESIRNTYDAYGGGMNLNNSYEVVDTGVEADLNRFAVVTHSCRNTHYTYACHNSSDLFGCIGLRNKRYCILNKQYTKEEYEKLVPEIIAHMGSTPYADGNGRIYKYGEFLPTELSPFAYNETVAQEYYSKSKEQITEAGYRWRGPDMKQYSVTLESEDLPDHIRNVEDSILKEVIRCAHKGECKEQCMGAFRIIPSELEFYRAMNLPLPRLCSNCRHYSRLAKRTPFKLWDRQCHCGGHQSSNGVYRNSTDHSHGAATCLNSFKTSYAPDRPEIVYCEQCYNAEVV